MQDSLLVEALRDSRAALAGVGGLDARELLARVSLLEVAAAAVRLEPSSKDELVRLAKVILETREQAVALRRRCETAREATERAMD